MKLTWLLGLLVAGQFAVAAQLINGAGATFPNPIYTQWIADYQKVDSSVQINYQPIGSGGGIRQFSEKTVDFGATDSPMTKEQLEKAGQPVVHIPTVLGAVVVTYNLPGQTTPLKLSGEVLADIFLGKIKKWNDARLVKDNPSLEKVANDIVVVHRSDGSGTTAIFTDFLSKANAEWKTKVGTNTALDWPTGLGGKGNDGVTGLIKQSPNSIGYTELIFAVKNNLPHASIKNSAGQFVTASTETVSAAAESVKAIPEDLIASITNAGGKKSYPISGYTYLLLWKTMPDAAKGEKLVKFLNWALHDGQKAAKELHYSPLPSTMLPKVEAKLKTIDFKKMN